MVIQNRSRLIISVVAFAFFVALFPVSSSDASGRGPTAPTNLVVSGVTETTISVSWSPSTHTRRFSYRVRLAHQSNPSTYTLATVAQSQTTYTARFLSPGRTYSLTVYAVDDRGQQSANSNTLPATTPADTTPPTAPVLETFVLGPSQIQLTWSGSTDNIPWNCCSYRFLMKGTPLTQHVNWHGTNSVIIRHLTPSTTYTFNVTATDYQGNTSTSNTSAGTTEFSSDVVPPTAPTNVHQVMRENVCGEVYVGWTEAMDDIDPQSAIEYEIYVNGLLVPLTVRAGVNEGYIYPLEPGDNEFVIRAVDRTGNRSAPSASLRLHVPC